MAVDAFIFFVPDSSAGYPAPQGETQDKDFSTKNAFELKDFSIGTENPTTIGSGTSGAGAGKIKFNEFSITKTIDKATPIFFINMVGGAHYSNVCVSIRKAGASKGKAGTPYLEYCFQTVFTTKIEISGPGDEAPEEKITFAFGQLGIRYAKQDKSGALTTNKFAGWNQLTNKSWSPQKSDFSGF